jgi:hypothetical protein
MACPLIPRTPIGFQAGLRLLALTAWPALSAAHICLIHVASVDVSSTTVPADPTFIGTSAASVAWNGSEPCLAGWNAGMATSVAIVRITNVYGTPVFGTPFATVSVVSGFGVNAAAPACERRGTSSALHASGRTA